MQIKISYRSLKLKQKTVHTDYEYEWKLNQREIEDIKNRIAGINGVEYFSNVFGSGNEDGNDGEFFDGWMLSCYYKYGKGGAVELRLRNVKAPGRKYWCVRLLECNVDFYIKGKNDQMKLRNVARNFAKFDPYTLMFAAKIQDNVIFHRH